MTPFLISIKDYLGKYYSELAYSANQAKYNNTKLDCFFDQRFLVQTNKLQMVIDPTMLGLSIVVSGNEIHVSKELYDHDNIVVTNSLENTQFTNPKGLYNSDIFSTMAYLVCQNHTSFHIIGDLDEPIYIKYRSDYETFYNSVVIFNISEDIEVEIVEEIESLCALNCVTNYILYPATKFNLTTFYNNNITSLSFCYRNLIMQDDSKFNHMLFGKGSASIIDETKIISGNGAESYMSGLVNSNGRNFHSVLSVEPETENYKISVDYKNILSDDHNITFFPFIIGQEELSESAQIEVSNIILEEIPNDQREFEIKQYIADFMENSKTVKLLGVKRFYDNKNKFLCFL